MMKTIEQALSLLYAFSETAPERGLTELADTAGFDKAKTRRYLLALMRRGFIEQNQDDRKYRLGPALLGLARLRETCFPLEAQVAPVLGSLVRLTEETAHLSLHSAGGLRNAFVLESPKANRVSMTTGERLPLHATASGLAFVAHQDEEHWHDLLKGRLTAYTAATITDKKNLFRTLHTVRQTGMACANGTYDEGVRSYAIPVFGRRLNVRGALAVAAPASRVTRMHEACIRKALKEATEQLAEVSVLLP